METWRIHSSIDINILILIYSLDKLSLITTRSVLIAGSQHVTSIGVMIQADSGLLTDQVLSSLVLPVTRK